MYIHSDSKGTASLGTPLTSLNDLSGMKGMSLYYVRMRVVHCMLNLNVPIPICIYVQMYVCMLHI